MLDISRCSGCHIGGGDDSERHVLAAALPSLVLIDFDAASLPAAEISCEADRADVYEVLFALAEMGGLFALAQEQQQQQQKQHQCGSSSEEEGGGFWHDLERVLVANKLGAGVHTHIMSFEAFRAQFADEMRRLVESAADEEMRVVAELVELVVARGEVGFPGEQRVRSVLGMGAGGE
jgi:hypothetical protein